MRYTKKTLLASLMTTSSLALLLASNPARAVTLDLNNSLWGTDSSGSGGNPYNTVAAGVGSTNVNPFSTSTTIVASPINNGSNGVYSFGLGNSNLLSSQQVSSFNTQGTDLSNSSYTKLVFTLQNGESFLFGAATGNVASMTQSGNSVTVILQVIDPVASASDPTGALLQASGGVQIFTNKTNTGAASGLTSQGGTMFYTNFFYQDVQAPTNITTGFTGAELRASGVNGVQGTFGALIPASQLEAIGLSPLSITGSRDGQAPTGFVFTQDASKSFGVNGAQVTFYNFVLKNSSWSTRDVQFGQGDGNSVVTGVISDQGIYTSFTKTGKGTVTLSAVNTYSGGTNINDGVLAISADNNLGASSGNISFNGGTLRTDAGITSARNISLGTNGGSINTDGKDSTFSGNISGTGALTKTGLGKLNLTGTNTYTGPTTVNQGILAANGSLVSAVMVETAGQLQGSGSFGGGKISGILAPGNSIGTITSNGNLTFASGSTYQVEVDASGNSDKTVVNGVATLQGGTVAISGNLPSTPLAALNTKYTILTATNGVSGQFASVSGLPSYSFLTGGLSYGANDVTLGYTFATPFSTVAKNINQRNVGNALTIAALGPVSSLGAPILNTLFSTDYTSAQSVMDTVSGSGLAGVQSTAMQVGQMASSSVSDQIAFWRSGETMDATGRTSQEGNNPRNFLAYAPTETKVPAKGPINLKGPAGSLTAAVAPRTYRAWGSMFGGGANYLSDAGRGAAASNIGYYGGLIGVDYQIQPNILVGVALGGSGSNFNVGSLSTNGNLTGFHAGVYGAYTMGNSYVALNETFSAYSNQTSRKAGGYAYLPYEQLSAQFGSTEFRTRGELGHGVLMGGLKATPFVAAEIAAYQSNAFSEQSSIYASTFALKNNGQGVNSLPTFAGLRLSNAVTLSNGWRLAPVGSVAYVHEFFPQRQFNNILMSMPGADFNVAGPRSTYNLVQTKVGAQLNLNEKLALFTDFQGEFSPVSQSYGGKGGLKYVW